MTPSRQRRDDDLPPGVRIIPGNPLFSRRDTPQVDREKLGKASAKRRASM